jgi:hypothetical protein
MKFGRLRVLAALGSLILVAATWVMAEFGSTALAAAGQTAALLGVVLFAALLQRRDARRLARRVDEIRNHLAAASRDTGAAPVRASGEGVMPEERFEQLARLLAANNRRLERAIDDLAQRVSRTLDLTTVAATDDQPGPPERAS